MPGRPVPRRAADLLSGTDAGTTVHVAVPTRGSGAETSRAIEQIDRRLGEPPAPLDWFTFGPDSPGLNSGKAWLRPRTDNGDTDAGGGGPGVVALGSNELLPYAHGNNPGCPAVTVRPDGTSIVAWQDLDTGSLTITHIARDATTLDTIQIPGTVIGEHVGPGGFGFLPTGDSDLLTHVHGASWSVTTSPLTATPATAHPPPGGWLVWGYAPTSQARIGDVTATPVDTLIVLSHASGAVNYVPTPGSAMASTVIAEDGAFTIAIDRGDYRGFDLYRLTTDGTFTGPVESGPFQNTTSFPGAGRPGLYAGMEERDDTPGENPTIRATDGTILDAQSWATDVEPWAGSYAGSVGTPGGGLLTFWCVETLGPTGTGYFGVTTTTATGQATLDLHPAGRGVNWAAAPVVGVNGSTATVAFVGYHDDYPLPNRLGLTVWTYDLGGAQGVLDLPTIDGWWTIGTRDPQMQWEFLVPTPLGWWVEIVAGEAHDMEFCVPAPLHPAAGEDGWVVVALMRPET